MSSGQEERITSALDAYRSGRYKSKREVARLWNVPEATFRARLKGIQPRHASHVGQQLLDHTQESLLVQWILNVEAAGYSISHVQVKEMIKIIMHCSQCPDPIPSVGHQWVQRFKKRNPSVAALLDRRGCSIGLRRLHDFQNNLAPLALRPYATHTCVQDKSSSVPENRPVLDSIDTEILQHYLTSTYLSLAANEETKITWQNTVPEIAYRHPFLMHGILACSAQHLAQSRPARRQIFTLRALSHQDEAMPLFRFAAENPERDNCHAVLAFTHLLVIYSFATSPQDASLLLVDSIGTESLPSWLCFLRGFCSMLCDFWEQAILTGPLQSLAAVWEAPIDINEDDQSSLRDFFFSVIPDASSGGGWTAETVAAYREAAIELARAFLCMNALGPAATFWDALRLWPLEVSDKYMELLRDRHPGALILMAHWCIMLNSTRSQWYSEDLAPRMLLGILQQLDARWHCYMQRPLEEVMK